MTSFIKMRHPLPAGIASKVCLESETGTDVGCASLSIFASNEKFEKKRKENLKPPPLPLSPSTSTSTSASQK